MSLYNRTGYIRVLRHLWTGAVDARISPRCSHPRHGLFTALLPDLQVIWWTLHILHAASLGFCKWISEAWAATFLALCTRCTLTWAAESLNTCRARLWPFRWHHEPSERRERKSWREWLLTVKSINWMSGQLLRGLSCTALIKQRGHYVLNGQKKHLSTWRLGYDRDCVGCLSSFISTEAPGASLKLRQTHRHQKTPLLSFPGDSLPPSIFNFVYV